MLHPSVLPTCTCAYTMPLSLMKTKRDIYSKSENLEYSNLRARKEPKDDLN